MSDVKKSKWPIALFWVIVTLGVIGSVGFIFKDKIADRFFGEKSVEVVIDSVSIVETPPTIDEVVQLRRDVIESKKIDSIYFAMSDVELTAILMKIGTNGTTSDIVAAYKKLQPQLKDVLLGADIAEKLIQERQQKIPLEPDSIPKQPLPSK